MSRFENIYNAILTTIPTLFPDKSRIFDPYNLDNNAEHIMRNGWGLKINTSIPAPTTLNLFINSRTFGIVLTREVIKTDSNQNTQTDTQIINLIDDAVVVQKEFYDPKELGVPDDVRQIDLSDTTAIDKIQGDKSDFIFLEVNFDILIKEEV